MPFSSLMSKGLWVVALGPRISLRSLRPIVGYFSQPHLETHGLTISQFLSLMDSTKIEQNSSESTSFIPITPSSLKSTDILESENLSDNETPSPSKCRILDTLLDRQE